MSAPAVERPAFPAVKRRYSASEHAPKFARMFVRAQMSAWRLCHMADAVEMAASELVTNAVRHAGGVEVRVCLEKRPAAVIVSVSDSSLVPPVMTVCDLMADSGRGLAVVRGLSTHAGCTLNGTGGKTVWAEIPR